MKILVCDPIHEVGIEELEQAGFEVDIKPSISGEGLRNAVSNYDVLIVRSRTKVTKEIVEAGNRLRVIGRSGAGLDNIDVEATEKKGVKVLNTPEGPAEAVAELTIGLMLSLTRNIPLADRSMKERKWSRKNLIGWELRGKTLGTIG